MGVMLRPATLVGSECGAVLTVLARHDASADAGADAGADLAEVASCWWPDAAGANTRYQIIEHNQRQLADYLGASWPAAATEEPFPLQRARVERVRGPGGFPILQPSRPERAPTGKRWRGPRVQTREPVPPPLVLYPNQPVLLLPPHRYAENLFQHLPAGCPTTHLRRAQPGITRAQLARAIAREDAPGGDPARAARLRALYRRAAVRADAAYAVLRRR